MPQISFASVLCVAAGGALGASARYLVATLAAARFGAAFPVGTALVNIVGSFLLGLAAALLVEAAGDAAGPGARLRAAFVMTGVLGGFTTFSAYALDIVVLAERGAWLPAALYMTISVAGSVAALLAGLGIARAITA